MSTVATFNDFAPFVLLFLLAHGAFIYLLCKSCYAKGYQHGRNYEQASIPSKILQAKREGAMAERQRLSPNSTSKD